MMHHATLTYAEFITAKSVRLCNFWKLLPFKIFFKFVFKTLDYGSFFKLSIKLWNSAKMFFFL